MREKGINDTYRTASPEEILDTVRRCQRALDDARYIGGLRDQYAQAALTGILANSSLQAPAEYAVKTAFLYADLCLEERKKCL